MSTTVTLGIVGDYDPTFEPHGATNEALRHAAEHLSLAVESRWIPTPPLEVPDAWRALDGLDGIWLAPGLPTSFDGALVAARFARERALPLFGN